jgi:hypothetical protein
VRDILGHANIDVTQNVYGKSWWEERVDAVTQAVEAVTNNARNAAKEEKRNQPESAPAEGQQLPVFRSASCAEFEPAAVNLHGGVCEGGEPMTPWGT